MLQKLKNQKGIVPLASTVLGVSILGVISLMTTNWVLSFRTNNNVKQTLEGKTIAMNKWDEVIHQNLNEKETNINKVVTTTDETGHTITVTYGHQGAFRNEKCDTTASQDAINNTYQKCTDVTVNVKDKDGKDMYEMKSINVLSSTYIYPIGAIVPYAGKIDDIPSNWRLCDGTNGTPNLNGMYLKGTSEQDEIGKTGGNNTFSIQQANLPSATFDISSSEPILLGSHNHPIPNPIPGSTMYFCDFNDSLSLTMHDLATYIHIPDWKGEPFPVAPYHQTVAYIIKVN